MLLPPLNMQTPVRIEQVAPLSALSGLQTGAAACFSEHRAGDPVTYHQSSLFSEIFKFFFSFFPACSDSLKCVTFVDEKMKSSLNRR